MREEREIRRRKEGKIDEEEEGKRYASVYICRYLTFNIIFS
jgi:hypothetical protein